MEGRALLTPDFSLERIMIKQLVLAIFAAGVPCFALGVSGQDQDKPDKRDLLAKEATERFVKALIAEDVGAVMKVADVPFFWDGRQIVQERDKLRVEFERVFARKDLTQLQYEIKECHAFDKLPKNAFSESDRKLLGGILENSDRIVLVMWKAPARDGMAIAVRIREGKATVAGFRD